MELSNLESVVIDTSFRAALDRMAEQGRIATMQRDVDPKLEVAAIMKRMDGDQALHFPNVRGNDIPVVGNVLSCEKNCEAAFGLGFEGLRSLIDRALGSPLPPEGASHAPVQEVVQRDNIDIGQSLPALFHAPNDGGRYITAGIVITRDMETGVYNASYHRFQLIGPDRLAIKLDFGRHLRLAFERAKQQGKNLPIAIVIGADIALHFTAATMGSQMPEGADELAAAGGLSGRSLPVTWAVSQDLMVPADAEIVLEGEINVEETIAEGPFGEFVGFAAPAADAPVVNITAMTHRKSPIYHAINGYGRETIMLRKYVLEASLLRVLRTSIPIVEDVELTAGGLHRFHAVVKVRKKSQQDNGIQRNAILASFGALKDLDLVTVVDHDIDIHDPLDVEYAIATRMEASRDLILIPEARGHEYVRIGNGGIRTKLGIDATVPFEDIDEFRRVEFADALFEMDELTTDRAAIQSLIGDNPS